MDQSVSPGKDVHYDTMYQTDLICGAYLFRKDTDTWTRVCLLIYLEKTPGTLMPWTGVCIK